MRYIKIIAIAFIFTLGACGKDGKLLTFTISDTTTTTVDANILPFSLPFELPTPEVTTNSEAEFEQNDTRVDLVKDITLTQVQLTITSPADKTFSFLKSIKIYISADGVDEILLASKEDISSSAQTLNLDLTDQSLDDYVKSSSYKLRTTVVTKETLTEEIDIQIFTEFEVTADLL